MKKIIALILLSSAPLAAVFAQSESNKSASASHSAVLALNNSIDISFLQSGSPNGADATMDFRNPNDYSNGVTSAEQQLRVRSNKHFKVAVRCDANSFAYDGASSQHPTQMPNDALWLKVTRNRTGGSVQAPFSTNTFANLSTGNQDLLVNGQNGGNQTFAVKYKCTPGFNLPAGTYTMNVVYTATQE